MYIITLPALIGRINRHLKPRGQMLRRSRSRRTRSYVGEYYLFNVERNMIVRDRVNPEALGRELNVLAPYEVVNEPENGGAECCS